MIPVHICLFLKNYYFQKKNLTQDFNLAPKFVNESVEKIETRSISLSPACLPASFWSSRCRHDSRAVCFRWTGQRTRGHFLFSLSIPSTCNSKKERERQHKKSHCTSSLFLFNPFSILLFVVRKILPPDITRNRTCRPWLLFYYKWRKVSYDVWGNVIQKATLYLTYFFSFLSFFFSKETNRQR